MKPVLTGVILAGIAFLKLNASEAAADVRTHTVVDYAIPDSLTGRPGDPVRGERIVRDTDNATCLICHSLPIPGEPDPGDIGPPLQGVGSRYTEGEIRLRLVDPKLLNPDTAMPSYYKVEGLHRVAPEFRGEPIYSAQDVEDVVAYLMTLVEE